jgi:hypothetical protein
LEDIIEGKMEGVIQLKGRQGRRSKKILDDFSEKLEYMKLK